MPADRVPKEIYPPRPDPKTRRQTQRMLNLANNENQRAILTPCSPGYPRKKFRRLVRSHHVVAATRTGSRCSPIGHLYRAQFRANANASVDGGNNCEDE